MPAKVYFFSTRVTAAVLQLWAYDVNSCFGFTSFFV
jgi:hypothetical protein